MKTTTCSILRYSRVASIALLGALVFPAAADAKPKDKSKGSKARSTAPAQVETVRTRAASNDGRSSGARSYDGRSRSSNDRTYDRRYDRSRSSYHSHPRSGFSLSFGTGYLGSGYYYGPPGASYYYERPDVRYYRNRNDVPGSYWGRSSSYSGGGTDVAVQRALYRLGYYRGPIDGDIGPGTRRAIARFEAANGLPVRGYVNRTLIDALGLR